MILNFGSINIDLVYRVPHLPTAGETLHSASFERFLGGKGINQSIAVAQSGTAVRHIGCVGSDGDWVKSQIANFGVALDEIATVGAATGHAVICVDNAGENQIVLASGANQGFTTAQIDAAISAATTGDWVILQNETNLVPTIAAKAKAAGLNVCYSAAPFDPDAVAEVLPHIDLLAVNEGEAAALEADHGKPATELGVGKVLVTKGAEGAWFYEGDKSHTQTSFQVTPVDTTGAGDTFLGAFMARLTDSDAPTALRFAAASAALQVTRAGAAAAIPCRADVEVFLAHA